MKKSRKLSVEETIVSYGLTQEITACVDKFCAENSVEPLGVVTMALTAVIIGAIMGSVPSEGWSEAAELISNNITLAMQKASESPLKGEVN